MSLPTVVIGLLGTQLDTGKAADRWEKWRPSIALCQHEDLLLSRFELLCQQKFCDLAEKVMADMRQVSPETLVRRHEVAFEDPWDFEEVYSVLHDWAKAYPFRPEEEDYLIHITTGSHVAQICLFLLTETRYLPGKLIQTAPPRRQDPAAGTFEIIDLDLSKYDRLATRFHREQREGLSFLKSGIDTRNRQFNELIERIERVAISSKAPLLLMGPTGSGKSQLARRIYELKKARRQVAGPFVEVNCATLRGDGAMSALFGHVKGAFTGALSDRPGLLRQANSGIVFLDEIGELGRDEQAMMLRALEEKRFLPLGSDREAQSDFQLIAGTNRDLHAAVAAGQFREDLLARINLWTFRLPALRERPEDIAPNVRYELEQVARTEGANVTFNKEAMELFLRFGTSPEALWSANFRDLNGAILRMATLAVAGRITVSVVEEEIERLRCSWRNAERVPGDQENVLEDALGAERLAGLDPFDAVQLAHVIRTCRTSRSLSEAGRRLFASSRQSKVQPNDADRLRKYLARFGLDWRTLVQSEI